MGNLATRWTELLRRGGCQSPLLAARKEGYRRTTTLPELRSTPYTSRPAPICGLRSNAELVCAAARIMGNLATRWTELLHHKATWVVAYFDQNLTPDCINGFVALRGAAGAAIWHALLSALAGSARARETTNSSCVSGDSLGWRAPECVAEKQLTAHVLVA